MKNVVTGQKYFELRNGLANCRSRFAQDKTGRIAFLGGSITESVGWRDQVIRYFQETFPQTTFDVVSAGIASLGSVPHAFRLGRDVLSHGPVDLLFVEAAVNDAANIPDHPEQMLRGMEGVVRHMRLVNPLTDIVQMHFVMPEHMAVYNAGKTPVVIAQHETVAITYGNPSVNLAREVTDRINAGEFTWEGDFQDLHPSPFGHQLYAHSIIRMLNAAFARARGAVKPHALPAPLDHTSYFRGRFGNIAAARTLTGFKLEPTWKPTDDKKTRLGFVDVPALVGTEAGAEFEFSFSGTCAGLFITAGPDAGRIAFSMDGGPYRAVETTTRWSAGLHLPWAVVLDDQLTDGPHTVRVRIITGALRVFHLLMNGTQTANKEH